MSTCGHRAGRGGGLTKKKDTNNDGVADTPGDLAAQYAAYKPYFSKKLREAVGDDALIIANAGTLSGGDPSLNGITIEAENWRESLDAARASGDLPAALSDGLIEILSLVASLSGGRDTLDVTLGLDAGTVRLGPLPIAELPPLRWR